MEKLEEHIRRKRGDLDMYTPPAGTWKKIRKELRKDRARKRQWLLIAAMIVVVLGTALALFKPEFRWSGSHKQTNVEAGLTQFNPQLKETEVYYNTIINSLYQEASPLLAKNPDLGKELYSDLSQLDSICADIKRDLKDNISTRNVVEALIQNYRIKIRILEEMLSTLKENEDNPDKKKNYEL